MSIKISDYVFDGPYTSTKDLMNDPGVFAVIVAREKKGTLIDIGESNNIKESVESHENKPRWEKIASFGTLCFATLYTPHHNRTERSSIEQNIRNQYKHETN
jgi:hypothetical protein